MEIVCLFISSSGSTTALSSNYHFEHLHLRGAASSLPSYIRFATRPVVSLPPPHPHILRGPDQAGIMTAELTAAMRGDVTRGCHVSRVAALMSPDENVPHLVSRRGGEVLKVRTVRLCPKSPLSPFLSQPAPAPP